MQGPEFWLLELGVELPCVVDASQEAVLVESHRVFVNYETYYLSSPKAVETFKKAPWRYTGPVTDPVSGERFQPSGDSRQTKYDGRMYYFSSAANASAFAENPTAHATPVVPYAGNM